MRLSVKSFLLCLCLATCTATFALARRSTGVPPNGMQPYMIPTIVLYGDDSDDDRYLPLKRLSVIVQTDMELLWSDLNIDTNDWVPTDPFGVGKAAQSDYPMLYATQGFIAFEREYKFGQLEQLIAECKRAEQIVSNAAAKRALNAILNAAMLQKRHHGTLSFRGGMCDPSDARENDICPK